MDPLNISGAIKITVGTVTIWPLWSMESRKLVQLMVNQNSQLIEFLVWTRKNIGRLNHIDLGQVVQWNILITLHFQQFFICIMLTSFFWCISDSHPAQRCIMPKTVDASGAPDIDRKERVHRPSTQLSTDSQKALNWYIGRRPRTAFTSLQVSAVLNLSSSTCSPLLR